MRVVRIIARLNIGGPAIHTILLTRHMQRLGYETLLVAGQVAQGEGDMAYLAEAQGLKPVIVPELGRRLWPADDLVALFRILRLFFKFRPQIIHTHTAKAGTLGRIAALLYNTIQSLRSTPLCFLQKISILKFRNRQSTIDNRQSKVVHTFHGHVLRGYFSPFKSRLFQGVERVLARFSDIIVVLSEQQEEELCNDFGIGWPGQYRVIPLGFDLTPFSRCVANRNQFRAQLGLPARSFVFAGAAGVSDNGIRLVGIIGRLTPIKNHRMFLEAIQVLIKTKPDPRTHFLIVGDGELRRDLQDLTQRLCLSDQVVFTGWMKEMAPVYADLDVLALTSHNEGTPVTVIEAMAAGVPVIATDVGGVRGLISDVGFRISELEEGEFEVCERGVLVNPGDVEAFAHGLQYLLEHPDSCKEMGQRGRDYALKHHGKERLIADIDRLYQSLIAD